MEFESPFHRSARLAPWPEVLTCVPTAIHESAPCRTPRTAGRLAPRGFWVGVIDHPGPEAAAAEGASPPMAETWPLSPGAFAWAETGLR